MADFEERVTVTVAGGDALARAGAEAEGAAKGVGKLKDELAELGGASAGADAAGASLGHVRDEALESAAAVKAAKASLDGYRDSAGRLRANGKFISESGLRDLLSAGEAAGKIDKSLGAIGSGGSGGRSGLSRIGRDAGDAERGLRDVETAAGDAEKALGGGAGGGGLFSSIGGLEGFGGAFGQAGSAAQAAAMPAAIIGIASAITTIGPALLATGAGFGAWGAMAAPALIKVKDGLTSVTTAQQAYQQAAAVYRQDPTVAHAASEKAALDQLRATWAQLPAGVSKGVSAIQQAEHAFSAAGKPIQAQALADIPKLAKDVQGLTPALSGLAKAGGPLVSGLLKDFGKFEQSKGFSGFVHNLESEASGAAGPLKQLGGALGAIGTKLFSKSNVKIGDQFIKSIAGMTKEFGPGAVKSLGATAKDLSSIMNTITKAANSPLGHAFGDVMNVAGKAGGFSWKDLPKLGASLFEKQAQLGVKAAGNAGLTGGKAGEIKIKAEVSGAGAAKAQLDALTKAASKTQTDKVKVDVSGAQGAAATLKQVGQAGTAMGSGVAAGAGHATASARAMAGNVKGAVAPLPGEMHAVGAQAGAGLAAGLSAETGAVSAAAANLAAAAESAAKVHLQISSPSKKFKTIGTQTWQGYVLGLEGGQSQVDAATKAMLGSLPFKDSAITTTVKAIRKEIGLAASSGKINPLQKMGLTQLLDQDNAKLMSLASKRQGLISKINAAEALATSVQQAAAQGADLGSIAASTITGQQDASAASGSGNIADVPTGPTHLKSGLQAQLSAIKQFNSQLKTLKKDGLDKAGIKELANDGVAAGSEAASQILAGGKKGVQAIAQLDNSIGLASKKLGITAGNAAYESGSQVGGQLAAGLKSQLKAVTKEMGALDKGLLTAIMTGLGESPKQIAAAMKKLDKELGLGSGASGGSSSGKVTAPHIINAPKTNQGRFAQPGPIGTPPHVVTPAFASAGSGAGGPIVVNLTSTLVVSGRALAKVTQTKTLQRAASNTSSGMVLPGRVS